MQQAGRAAGTRAGGAGGVLARRLRSLLRLSSVAPPLSPFSPLLHRPRVPPAFFPSASALARFAIASLSGWPRGAGGNPLALSCASFSPFALRSAVRPTRLSPAPCSRGFFQQAAPAFSRPQFAARGRCGRLSAASLRSSPTGGAGAACFHHPLSSRQCGAAASALSPSGTLARGIRRDLAFALALRASAAAPPCLLPPPAPPALVPAARPACPCGVCSTWNIVVAATIHNRK